MSIDEGMQAYLQETSELLDQTEDTLLNLENSPTDEGLINELFRAVHTIKGASGLFGFDAVVEFTHDAESVMGRTREGDLTIDSDLLTLFLKCRDHISTLVDLAVAGEVELPDETQATDAALRTQLHIYLGTPTTEDVEVPPVVAHDEPPAAIAEETERASGIENEAWHISLRFTAEILRNGMDPLSFFRYLDTIGDIVHLTTIDDNIPALAEMNPEDSYLGFELDLLSPATKDEIEEVFEFVQEDCDLHIIPPNSHISLYAALIDELPDENMRIGEILTLSGTLTQRELIEALTLQSITNAENIKINEQNAEQDATIETIPPKPLGEVIVENKLASPKIVKAALQKQEKVKATKAKEQAIVRVSAEKLEELINLVGELVISGANTRVLAAHTEDADILEAVDNMSRLVEEIRDNALGLRMVQIGETFNRYRRVVRELSKEVGKEIELKISGGDTELDKTVVEKITDPLMHLVRNSIDHGIESPEERVATGKPPVATVSLNAYTESGTIIIEVSDDGGGIPQNVILAKALEKGLVTEEQKLTENEIYHLIFEPGFSTAEAVTNISGRGVGMDVVRKNIDALRGHIDIESHPGIGTTFRIHLPLTLAIIDGFQVQVGDARYIIPLALVDECMELDEVVTDQADGKNYVNLRGDALPYIRLNELFGVKQREKRGEQQKHRDNIVIVQSGTQRAGLVVDELLGEFQTVIKPLGTIFQNLKGFSGATILGSGEVAMIIDVAGLLNRVMSQNTKPGHDVTKENQSQLH
ncbi:MAG: chemotaxis protein CheA [Candidatus Polarisedimenticolaceae bacterium]|nr:chemotaxis protein CheA [Candidatus Polarisedimenticolaceae bacterium]